MSLLFADPKDGFSRVEAFMLNIILKNKILFTSMQRNITDVLNKK